MTTRIRKGLSALLVICTVSMVPNTAIAAETMKQTSISEVAEQKSVIDEQATITSLGPGVKDTDTNIVVEEVVYKWTTTSVNVRETPSLESNIYEVYSRNTKVEYVSEDNGWTKIKYNAGFAYIKSDYLVAEEQASNSPYTDLINSLTDDEKYLIYQITYAEAGDQTMEGQRAVIEVILNRVLSNKYPNTVEAVLSQKGQFTTWKRRNKVKHNQEQVTALNLVASESPVLNLNYLMFSMGKNSWGRNYIKVDDQWFGTF